SVVATSNTIGCSIMHTTYFKVLELTIPEGFSPNKDGINDYFEIPEIYEYSNVELKVWNRWGDIVFESDNYRNEWDGTCKGQFCIGSDVVPEGTYYYTISIGGYEFKGFITIKL
ncbi:MAG TPA: gliding motility-associated C-terminal domain-containing protein, partial [Taishania sp.]|nr:gliding motility-associated C-terminal domain-containing protein [Taishania sp.]